MTEPYKNAKWKVVAKKKFYLSNRDTSSLETIHHILDRKRVLGLTTVLLRIPCETSKLQLLSFDM